jgi:ABC-2 type transport system permease protein
VATLYVGWLRARLRSSIFWTIGVAAVLVVTAAFYPSLKNFFADFQSQGSAGVSSLLGLTNGIDPSSPLGYLWSNLYSNVLPWMLMALGISLGANAIAGDEEVGTLEYTLSSAATRAQILVTRCAGVVTPPDRLTLAIDTDTSSPCLTFDQFGFVGDHFGSRRRHLHATSRA